MAVVMPADAPTLPDVLAYLAETGGSWPEEQVAAALAAERVDQANRCRFPVGVDGVPTYDAALTEALMRRVAHNLAVRATPLGVRISLTEAAAVNTYVGGTDAEVRRLEAPYRKLVVG